MTRAHIARCFLAGWSVGTLLALTHGLVYGWWLPLIANVITVAALGGVWWGLGRNEGEKG